MPRPVTMPPSKFIGTRLSLDLVDEYERALAERGITKRELFERALRKELGIPEPEKKSGSAAA
ncbi:hypothetical protein ACTD5D_41205 [Nocardia takedensis]|uniref:hypothetical protein n=1 Tax=Nocardia takedensis TaxID=259390 RepID=UPI003F763C88